VLLLGGGLGRRACLLLVTLLCQEQQQGRRVPQGPRHPPWPHGGDPLPPHPRAGGGGHQGFGRRPLDPSRRGCRPCLGGVGPLHCDPRGGRQGGGGALDPRAAAAVSRHHGWDLAHRRLLLLAHRGSDLAHRSPSRDAWDLGQGLVGRRCVVQILCCWAGQGVAGGWGSPSLGGCHPLTLLLHGALQEVHTKIINTQ
jgi:hypothetical protein